MRALIVLDVEIDDGQRPGTGFARLQWVARSATRFVGIQRRVRKIHSASVHHPDAAHHLPALPIDTVELDASLERT